MKFIKIASIKRSFSIVFVLFAFLFTHSAIGQSEQLDNSIQTSINKSDTLKENTSNKSFFKQKHLTGNWWGARSFLEDRGLTFNFKYSSIYQGLMAGTGEKEFKYGGKVNALIQLETEKMKLWKGGKFNFHIEYRHGEAPANLGGALFTINTAIFLPSDSPEQIVASSINYTQIIGDGHQIALGKFNPIDLYDTDQFYGGWGVDRFMNIALLAPPSGLVPVVFMGGLVSINLKPITITAIVFDPKDRTNDYFPDDLFKEGVTFAANTTGVTKIAGRKTTYGITGFITTADGLDYSSIGSGVVNTNNKSGAFDVNVQFKHNLKESIENPNEAWGITFKAGIADGNPNYVRANIIAGIGGSPLFFGRPHDSFGLGYFFYNLSDVLEEYLSPFASGTDESGLELFYNYAITPWFYIGVDMQYIDPFRESFKNAFIGGIRTQIRI